MGLSDWEPVPGRPAPAEAPDEGATPDGSRGTEDGLAPAPSPADDGRDPTGRQPSDGTGSGRGGEGEGPLGDVLAAADGIRGRLERAGHKVFVQDLAGVEPPSVRMLLWPRPALFPEQLEGTADCHTLEITLGHPEPHAYAARHWSGVQAGRTHHLASIDEREARPEWFVDQIIRFVRRVLAAN